MKGALILVFLFCICAITKAQVIHSISTKWNEKDSTLTAYLPVSCPNICHTKTKKLYADKNGIFLSLEYAISGFTALDNRLDSFKLGKYPPANYRLNIFVETIGMYELKDTFSYWFPINAKVKTASLEKSIDLLPSSDSTLTLAFTLPVVDTSTYLYIRDSRGGVMHSQKISTLKDTITIDISTWMSDSYRLKITNKWYYGFSCSFRKSSRGKRRKG